MEKESKKNEPNDVESYQTLNINHSSNSYSNTDGDASAASVTKGLAESLSFPASHNHDNIQQYHEYIDALFDWGEANYKDVMPMHKDSYAIEDYYARIYDNGQAVGEKNGNIYHYDGYEIKLVGTADEIADMAGIEMMA